MTITLQAVNELIASLESAGELSIREQKFLKLAKAFKQLAEENAALKAGASYFSYGSEHNFEWHKTAEEAVEAAEAAIDDYRGEACDGWSEEVDSICWGIIMQSSTKVGERPRNEDDRCDPSIDTVCDYALLPNIETPATDAYLAGIKADGASAAGDYLKQEAQHMPVVERLMMQDAAEICYGTAARLREGGNGE